MTITHKHKIRAIPAQVYGRLCAQHDKSEEHAAEHTTFDRIVLAAILASIAVLIWSLIDHDHEELIETLDYGILVFFGVEIVIRIKRAGRNWYQDRWLWMDLVILAIALMPLGMDVIVARVVRGARLVHLSKHLPHLLSARILVAGIGIQGRRWISKIKITR